MPNEITPPIILYRARKHARTHKRGVISARAVLQQFSGYADTARKEYMYIHVQNVDIYFDLTRGEKTLALLASRSSNAPVFLLRSSRGGIRAIALAFRVPAIVTTARIYFRAYRRRAPWRGRRPLTLGVRNQGLPAERRSPSCNRLHPSSSALPSPPVPGALSNGSSRYTRA